MTADDAMEPPLREEGELILVDHKLSSSPKRRRSRSRTKRHQQRERPKRQQQPQQSSSSSHSMGNLRRQRGRQGQRQRHLSSTSRNKSRSNHNRNTFDSDADGDLEKSNSSRLPLTMAKAVTDTPGATAATAANEDNAPLAGNSMHSYHSINYNNSIIKQEEKPINHAGTSLVAKLSHSPNHITATPSVSLQLSTDSDDKIAMLASLLHKQTELIATLQQQQLCNDDSRSIGGLNYTNYATTTINEDRELQCSTEPSHSAHARLTTAAPQIITTAKSNNQETLLLLSEQNRVLMEQLQLLQPTKVVVPANTNIKHNSTSEHMRSRTSSTMHDTASPAGDPPGELGERKLQQRPYLTASVPAMISVDRDQFLENESLEDSETDSEISSKHKQTGSNKPQDEDEEQKSSDSSDNDANNDDDTVNNSGPQSVQQQKTANETDPSTAYVPLIVTIDPNERPMVPSDEDISVWTEYHAFLQQQEGIGNGSNHQQQAPMPQFASPTPRRNRGKFSQSEHATRTCLPFDGVAANDQDINDSLHSSMHDQQQPAAVQSEHSRGRMKKKFSLVQSPMIKTALKRASINPQTPGIMAKKQLLQISKFFGKSSSDVKRKKKGGQYYQHDEALGDGDSSCDFSLPPLLVDDKHNNKQQEELSSVQDDTDETPIHVDHDLDHPELAIPDQDADKNSRRRNRSASPNRKRFSLPIKKFFSSHHRKLRTSTLLDDADDSYSSFQSNSQGEHEDDPNQFLPPPSIRQLPSANRSNNADQPDEEDEDAAMNGAPFHGLAQPIRNKELRNMGDPDNVIVPKKPTLNHRGSDHKIRISLADELPILEDEALIDGSDHIVPPSKLQSPDPPSHFQNYVGIDNSNHGFGKSFGALMSDGDGDSTVNSQALSAKPTESIATATTLASTAVTARASSTAQRHPLSGLKHNSKRYEDNDAVAAAKEGRVKSSKSQVSKTKKIRTRDRSKSPSRRHRSDQKRKSKSKAVKKASAREPQHDDDGDRDSEMSSSELLEYINSTHGSSSSLKHKEAASNDDAEVKPSSQRDLKIKRSSLSSRNQGLFTKKSVGVESRTSSSRHRTPSSTAEERNGALTSHKSQKPSSSRNLASKEDGHDLERSGSVRRERSRRVKGATSKRREQKDNLLDSKSSSRHDRNESSLSNPGKYKDSHQVKMKLSDSQSSLIAQVDSLGASSRSRDGVMSRTKEAPDPTSLTPSDQSSIPSDTVEVMQLRRKVSLKCEKKEIASRLHDRQDGEHLNVLNPSSRSTRRREPQHATDKGEHELNPSTRSHHKSSRRKEKSQTPAQQPSEKLAPERFSDAEPYMRSRHHRTKQLNVSTHETQKETKRPSLSKKKSLSQVDQEDQVEVSTRPRRRLAKKATKSKSKRDILSTALSTDDAEVSSRTKHEALNGEVAEEDTMADALRLSKHDAKKRALKTSRRRSDTKMEARGLLPLDGGGGGDEDTDSSTDPSYTDKEVSFRVSKSVPDIPDDVEKVEKSRKKSKDSYQKPSSKQSSETAAQAEERPKTKRSSIKKSKEKVLSADCFIDKSKPERKKKSSRRSRIEVEN